MRVNYNTLMQLVDTHAHLDFTDDKEGWIERAKEAGVGKVICVGTSVEESKTCAVIAQKYSSGDLKIYATVGIHAQDGKGDFKKFGSIDKCADQLRKILGQVEKKRAYFLENLENDKKTIVAVGECGFDFKTERDTSTELSASQLPETRKFQEKLFRAQIKLAAELKLPLVVHCRNAWSETFALLGKFQNLSVFHSWTGDWETAQKALSLGFYISFSGIVTFKNAPSVQEVAKKMPLDKMLLETDSPFLSPEPMRGAQNEPKNVRIVAEFIAGLRNVPLDEIANVTSENAGRLFGI